jgi:hypothetical protein
VGAPEVAPDLPAVRALATLVAMHKQFKARPDVAHGAPPRSVMGWEGRPPGSCHGRGFPVTGRPRSCGAWSTSSRVTRPDVANSCVPPPTDARCADDRQATGAPNHLVSASRSAGSAASADSSRVAAQAMRESGRINSASAGRSPIVALATSTRPPTDRQPLAGRRGQQGRGAPGGPGTARRRTSSPDGRRVGLGRWRRCRPAGALLTLETPHRCRPSVPQAGMKSKN